MQSPPSRGRGSKRAARRRARRAARSRPLRGGVDRNSGSTRAAGAIARVAPFAGAWIETTGSPTARSSRLMSVAPFAGAWIETLPCTGIRQMDWSPPSRGRGSKHEFETRTLERCPSRPLRGGVDRNADIADIIEAHESSPPSRGRGSKLPISDAARLRYFSRPLRGGVDRNVYRRIAWQRGILRSPPSRGRGSKQPERRYDYLRIVGRPLRGGVDRNTVGIVRKPLDTGRPLRGGVDRNLQDAEQLRRLQSRPLRGGVDRNTLDDDSINHLIGRPLRGGVDRNSDGVNKAFPADTSPPSRGRGSKRPSLRLLDVRGRSPLRGGWIETNAPRLARRPSQVAPFAGAWIETSPSCAPG